MTTAEDVWKKLASSKKYREEFALSLLKRSVAFQVKTLRKKRCGSQAVLAERAKLTQGVVSRAEDQDYGNLTFNTVGRISGGLDMAFIGKFVPFSALVKYSLELSESQIGSIRTFDEENSDSALSFSAIGAAVRNPTEVTEEQEVGTHEVTGGSAMLQAGTTLGKIGQGQAPLEASALKQRSDRGQQLPLELLPGNVLQMPKRTTQSEGALAACARA